MMPAGRDRPGADVEDVAVADLARASCSAIGFVPGQSGAGSPSPKKAIGGHEHQRRQDARRRPSPTTILRPMM